MSRWNVYYWKARDKVVYGDNFGLVEFVGNPAKFKNVKFKGWPVPISGVGRYFIRTHTRSRMPKTLKLIGHIER